MKNKLVIIIVCVVILCMTLCITFILNGLKENENTDMTENNNEVTSNEFENLDENNKSEENNENKFEKVEPTSKIGSKILENFNYAYINYFSDMLYDELESNGFNDKNKLMYTYLYIVSTEKYIDLVEFSEEYHIDCISEKNMEKVAKEIFGNNFSLKHQDILNGNIYKSDSKIYQVIPMGFGGMNTEYSFDIPYEIKEYADSVEVICNRLYLTTNFAVEKYEEDEENKENDDGSLIAEEGDDGVKEESNNCISVFSNRNRSNLLLKIEDENFISSAFQGEILNEYIKDGKIKTDSLKKVKYILKNENDKYILTGIE